MEYAFGTRLAIALLLISGLLAGCAQSNLEIGMVETNLPGRWRASYATFDGTKTDRLEADAGQTLVLDAEAEVDKGNLTIEVRDPDDRVLWDLSLEQDGEESMELVLEQTGRYGIVVEGDNAGGSFNLTWELE